MLSYLVKFNALPKEIRDGVNAPSTVARISELEAEYGIELAPVIMKVMVREVRLDSLGAFLINEFGLTGERAAALDRALRRGVFFDVIDYLLGPDKGPKLVFDESDERDVKKAGQPLSTRDFDAAIDASVESIIRQARIRSDDPLAAGKFRQVIKTYLRGTRDKRATAETLTKASELGGVALSRDTAERVLLLADGFMPKLATSRIQPAIPLPEDTPVPLPSTRDVDYDLESALRERGGKTERIPAIPRPISAPKQQTAVTPVIDPGHELMPPVPVVIKAEAKKIEPAPAAPEAMIPGSDSAKGRLEVLKNLIAGKPLDKTGLRQLAQSEKADSPAIPKPMPGIENRQKSPTGKIKMDDIRFAPHAESPIDEIRSMTLRNFRRLSIDPVKATEKIRERMEMLGREEYGKKIEAIAAWHQSPVNRLYLEVGRRSLEENVGVKAILERELKSQPDFLKPAELEAIINLNRSLKF